MTEETMNNFFRNKSTDIKSLTQNTNTDSKGRESLPRGHVSSKVYGDYYDISDTITNATASDPNDFDSSSYDRERIFEIIGRNAEKLLVKNDGNDIIYVVTSHD